MKIGNLNTKIVIQKSEVVKDRIGNHTDRWVDYFFCSAYITHEKGDDTFTAGTENDHSDMNVTVRYCTETSAVRSTTHRILFRDEIYDILAVDHLNFKRHGIKFRCRKVRR